MLQSSSGRAQRWGQGYDRFWNVMVTQTGSRNTCNVKTVTTPGGLEKKDRYTCIPLVTRPAQQCAAKEWPAGTFAMPGHS